MSILETPSGAGGVPGGPAWMTSELDEEWPASPPMDLSPNGSSPSSSSSSAANKSALADRYGSIKWLGPKNGSTKDTRVTKHTQESDSNRKLTSSWGAGLEVDDQREEDIDDDLQSRNQAKGGPMDLWTDEEEEEEGGQEADELFEDARDHLHQGGSRRPSSSSSHHHQQQRLTSYSSLRRASSSSTTATGATAAKGFVPSRVFSPSTALNERINHGYLASSLVPSPPHSDASSSDGGGGGGGTFIVRSDSPVAASSGTMLVNGTSRVNVVDDQASASMIRRREEDSSSPPAFLRQLRQNQQQQNQGGGALFFEPLALEKMFMPPPPLSQQQQAELSSSSSLRGDPEHEPADDLEEAQQGGAAMPQASSGNAPREGSVRSHGSGSVGLYAQARRPGLPFERPAVAAVAATSHATQPQRASSSSSSSNPYAPRRPSGLSRSMTPPSPSLSAISRRTTPSSRGDVADSAAAPRALPPSSAGSSSARQADDEMDDDEAKEERRRDVKGGGGGGGTVRMNSKVSYIPSPRRFSGQTDSMLDVDFSFSPPAPPLAAAAQRLVTPPNGPAFKLFQLRPDTFTKNHLSELVEQMSAHGTPVKEYAGRLGAGGRGERRLSSRRKSPASVGRLSAEKYRRDRHQPDASNTGSPSWSDEDGSEPRSAKRIRLSGGEEDRPREALDPTSARLSSFLPPVTQPKRTSWGERGEDLLNKIKQGAYASPSVSGASMTPGSSRQSAAPSPPMLPAESDIRGGGAGTQRSDPSSGSGTVTSQYASNGQTILERIRSRKVSESSGVGTGTDDQVAAGKERVLSDGSAEANAEAPERAFKRLELSEVKEVEEMSSVAASTRDSPRHKSKPQPPPPVAHGRALNVRHIAPSDLPRIPEQVGRMMFDRHQMRWIKAVSGSSAAMTDPSSSNSSGDVFEGIDSFRDTQIESAPRLEDKSNEQALEASSVEPVKTTPPSVLKKGPLTPAPVKNGEGSTESGRRNVSFSDGRKSGKMRDVTDRPAKRLWQSGDIEVVVEETPVSPLTPSRRSVSGSKQLSLSSLDDVMATPASDAFPDRSLFSRLRASGRKQANATFLTDCSFTVAHDKLVEIITEVQPFEPHWERLTQIDLSKKGATSLARLKEFLPILDEANLNDNEISYLSGIPATIRKLFVAGNRLTSLTAVNHLANLQYLDLSRNNLESVNQLSCLKHLRELRLDYNNISDIKDLLSIDSLTKVSCVGNKLTSVDFTGSKWDRMETLDLSCNKIAKIEGLEKLALLNTLNLDSNCILDLPIGSMPAMRILKISGNSLSRIPLHSLPRLRTLYADGNRIQHLGDIRVKASKLETLSVRNQLVKHFRIDFPTFPDLKRLYISGNDLATDFFPLEPAYSLAYLEAVACKLTRWPQAFAAMFANLRYVNLNYNLLPDLDGLEDLRSIKKLSMLGNRIGCDGLSEVIEQLRTMPRLQHVDLRMNPCTLHFYLPIVTPQTALAPERSASTEIKARSGDEKVWSKMDASFRNTLPDAWYCKRLTYRSLIAMACTSVTNIDGLEVTEAELRKGRSLIERAVESDDTL